MLAHIIHQVQEFHRVHGALPNVLYLNSGHYATLQKNNPEIFSDDNLPHEISLLGLKLVMVPPDFLPHPKVARVLYGMSQILHHKVSSGNKKRYIRHVGSRGLST